MASADSIVITLQAEPSPPPPVALYRVDLPEGGRYYTDRPPHDTAPHGSRVTLYVLGDVALADALELKRRAREAGTLASRALCAMADARAGEAWAAPLASVATRCARVRFRETTYMWGVARLHVGFYGRGWG